MVSVFKLRFGEENHDGRFSKQFNRKCYFKTVQSVLSLQKCVFPEREMRSLDFHNSFSGIYIRSLNLHTSVSRIAIRSLDLQTQEKE